VVVAVVQKHLEVQVESVEVELVVLEKAKVP
jgi:hypothetical protein